jgi:hypothetical protein
MSDDRSAGDEIDPLDAIARAVQISADRVCRDHYGTLTQEPPLTARIAHEIERTMHNHIFGGYRVQAIAQDVPDRGPRAMERRLGADLLRLVHHRRVMMSKGMLVQAKWDHVEDHDPRLNNQIRAMWRVSNACYVWEYTNRGVRARRINAILGERPLVQPGSRTLAPVFSEALRCHEGDFFREAEQAKATSKTQ